MTAIEPVLRLSRDMREAAITLSDDEVRYLVDGYYLMQDNRKRADNQLRALSENGEPSAVLSWLGEQSRVLENQVKAALDRYSLEHPVGKWARSITGLGPVITAGLLAHIDIERAPTVGHIWRFAGLDPTVKWEKGQKRPWNTPLKTLCWKLGESFVKVSNNDADFYGHIYAQRKERETVKNADKAFADQAAHILATKKIGKTTDAYKAYSEGRLPPAHIHARAKRYAVKLFLSHLHHKMYEDHYGEPPPKPYILTEAGGHAHYIAPPD